MGIRVLDLEERGHPPVTFAFSFLPGIPFIHTQPVHETRSHRTLLVDRLLILALSRNFNIYNSRTYVPTFLVVYQTQQTRLDRKNGGQQQPRPYRTLLSRYAHGHEALVV